MNVTRLMTVLGVRKVYWQNRPRIINNKKIIWMSQVWWRYLGCGNSTGKIDLWLKITKNYMIVTSLVTGLGVRKYYWQSGFSMEILITGGKWDNGGGGRGTDRGPRGGLPLLPDLRLHHQHRPVRTRHRALWLPVRIQNNRPSQWFPGFHLQV